MKPTGFSFLAPFHCFFFHGYEEELGGNGAIHSYSMEDVERSKVFTVTSSIEGETEKYGKFICREYQDVFILWWKADKPLETKLFAPLVQERKYLGLIFGWEGGD